MNEIVLRIACTSYTPGTKNEYGCMVDAPLDAPPEAVVIAIQDGIEELHYYEREHSLPLGPVRLEALTVDLEWEKAEWEKKAQMASGGTAT